VSFGWLRIKMIHQTTLRLDGFGANILLVWRLIKRTSQKSSLVLTAFPKKRNGSDGVIWNDSGKVGMGIELWRSQESTLSHGSTEL
jgi:hypothetical protein